MATKHKLTPEIARELFDYDQETGILTWKSREQKWFSYKDFHLHWNSRWAGRPVGTLSCRKYLVCNVLNKLHYVHRIIWMMFHAEEPPLVIDHINGISIDNRISNLRAATPKLNAENQRKKSSGKKLPLGVFPIASSKTGKVFARIIVNKRRVYLGAFDDPQEAHAVYLAAKRELHDGCSI